MTQRWNSEFIGKRRRSNLPTQTPPSLQDLILKRHPEVMTSWPEWLDPPSQIAKTLTPKIDATKLAQMLKPSRVLRTIQEFMGFDSNFTWLFVQTRDFLDQDDITSAVWYQGPGASGDEIRTRRAAGLRIVAAARRKLWRKHDPVHNCYCVARFLKSFPCRQRKWRNDIRERFFRDIRLHR